MAMLSLWTCLCLAAPFTVCIDRSTYFSLPILFLQTSAYWLFLSLWKQGEDNRSFLITKKKIHFPTDKLNFTQVKMMTSGMFFPGKFLEYYESKFIDLLTWLLLHHQHLLTQGCWVCLAVKCCLCQRCRRLQALSTCLLSCVLLQCLSFAAHLARGQNKKWKCHQIPQKIQCVTAVCYWDLRHSIIIICCRCYCLSTCCHVPTFNMEWDKMIYIIQ